MSHAASRRIGLLAGSIRGFLDFATLPHMQRRPDPGVCDFVFGNPHEPPMPEYVSALQRALVPRDKDWFAYKLNEPEATTVVSRSLSEQRGRQFSPEHIVMTNGTFAGLSIVLTAFVDPGDEVIYISPPWFFYEVLILAAGATPVRVDADRTSFDLDLDAIKASITERTRAVIVNSPNNPTGVIYPPDTLGRLGDLLRAASQRNGQPVYLFSDEAYNRIVFDGRPYPSPTDYYENSLLLYTYGKTLLTPGERLGYIAVSPAMPDPGRVLEALFVAQALTGWAFPVASLQHALAGIEGLSIDVGHLQDKRDRMAQGLSRAGYEVNHPEGTFYLMVRSPWPDDMAFCMALVEKGVFVLPGATFEMPGWFRISLTANEEMIARSLPVFESMAGTSPR
jgi:aspartate aminotransferase